MYHANRVEPTNQGCGTQLSKARPDSNKRSERIAGAKRRTCFHCRCGGLPSVDVEECFPAGAGAEQQHPASTCGSTERCLFECTSINFLSCVAACSAPPPEQAATHSIIMIKIGIPSVQYYCKLVFLL